MIWLFITIITCVLVLWGMLAHKVREVQHGEPHHVVHGLRNFADTAIGGASRRLSRVARHTVRGTFEGVAAVIRQIPHVLAVVGQRLSTLAISGWRMSAHLFRKLGHRIAPRHHRPEARENGSDIV
jgi:hypothetical protein